MNSSGAQGHTTPGIYPCGYCDRHCIYNAIETVFAIGIITNAIVLCRVAGDRKLRNPTFVSIAACAFADMCFLIIRLSSSFETVVMTITCNYPSKLVNNAYKIMSSVSWFSANGHVALLAIVRYILLVFPLKANIYLHPRRVLLLSALVWILGFLFIITVTAIGFINGISPTASLKFQLILWSTIYLTPLTITVTLHVVKIYKVRQTTSVTTSEEATRRIRTMSRMVIMVVFFATVLPLPYILNRFLQSVQLEVQIYGSKAIAVHVEYIVNLFMLLNHSINPVMYAFLSHAFRASLKRMLGLNINADYGRNGLVATPITSVSEIQRREQILQRMAD